jgi:uncharacterized damage-inducible protein DinB
MQDDPRYPIGRFQAPAGRLSEAERAARIEEIAQAPSRLREAVNGLSASQLDTPYREGGWTLRQVVHHVPDSHLNAYTRFKLALTEEDPLIRAYEEQLWAELPDSRTAPLEISLSLLEALHRRWVAVLESMTTEEFTRTFRHPDLGTVPLDRNLALYSWHGRHHVAHVTSLRERMGW